MIRIGIFLITVALLIAPTLIAGTVVSLVVTPASGYKFLNWSGDVDTVAHVNATSTNITMSGSDTYILICPNFRETPAGCGGLRY